MPISIFEYDREEELRKEYRHGKRDGERIGEQRGELRGVERGKAIGIKQGLSQGVSQSLLNILESYGEVPEELRTGISGQGNIKVLNNWHKTALQVSDVSEFRSKTGL